MCRRNGARRLIGGVLKGRVLQRETKIWRLEQDAAVCVQAVERAILEVQTRRRLRERRRVMRESATKRLRADVFRDAYEGARRAAEKLVRRKRIPLQEIAAVVTAGAERRMSGYLAGVPLGPLACGSGCFYCCHVPRVLVTVPEVAAIVDVVRLRPPADIDALRQRLEQYVEVDAEDDFIPGMLAPCPLLVDTRCLVYDARPLVCRTEHSYDAAGCEAQFRTGAGETLQCSLVLDTTDGTMRAVGDAFRSAGLRGELMNLSRALRVVLDDPRAIDQWLAGGSSLTLASVRDGE
jgi:Fe-S-cluster containining protein